MGKKGQDGRESGMDQEAEERREMRGEGGLRGREGKGGVSRMAGRREGGKVG